MKRTPKVGEYWKYIYGSGATMIVRIDSDMSFIIVSTDIQSNFGKRFHWKLSIPYFIENDKLIYLKAHNTPLWKVLNDPLRGHISDSEKPKQETKGRSRG